MASIPDFYMGQTIFITGGTGFMGKVLIEKLLRSCSGIKALYILIRPKKDKDTGARVEELFSSKLFDQVRRINPNFRKKVIPVEGDVMQPGFGLSESDKETIIQHVSIVFHVAATVRFDEALRLSVNLNVVAVRELLSLCHCMKSLAALVHVSTAYSNCDKEVISETVYEPNIKPDKLLHTIECMDDEKLEARTNTLIKPKPNTYTFTKSLAEYILLTEKGGIPCAICRPSVVGAAHQQPLPGWVDSMAGPAGLYTAVGKGVLRTMHGSPTAIADLIPVDIAINMLIAAAWHTGNEKPSSVLVFNCTTGMTNKVTWGEMAHAAVNHTITYAFNDPLWPPPRTFLSPRKLMRNISVCFDHYVPAYIMDGISLLIGAKPRMVRLQDKIWRYASPFEYFISHQWLFVDDNIRQLYNNMDEEDRKNFNIDVKQIDWAVYLKNYILGIKLYCLNEGLNTLPKSRNKMKRLIQLRRFLETTAFLSSIHFLSNKSKVTQEFWNTVLGAI